MTRRLGGLCLAIALTWACAGAPPVSTPPPSPPPSPVPQASSAEVDEFRAAGIFAVSRHQGAVLALFGLDAHTGRWADFVGYRKSGESAPQTAVREFTEETRGAWRSEVTAATLSVFGGASYRVGAVRIYLVEVSFREAAELAGLGVLTDTEKTYYCWVDLRALLASVDASDNPSVPPTCDGTGVDGRLGLRDVTTANLLPGGVLREPLDRIVADRP